MGFIATNLARVPSGAACQWYLFLLEDNWQDQFRRELADNFPNLAREVGARALVVRGANPEHFYDQVFYKYALRDRGMKQESFALPALLITDTPPTEIKEDRSRVERAKIIILPLAEHYRRAGSISDLLRDVARAMRDPNSFKALDSLEKTELDRCWGWMTRYFELKPQFLGFTIQLDNMIEDLFFPQRRK
jgi:hypothetical protein